MLAGACADCGGNQPAEPAWDGSFWRDLARYNGSGDLFWSVYLAAGSHGGDGGGFRFNIGPCSANLANDNPGQMLVAASPRLFYDAGAGQWKIVIDSNGPDIIWAGVKNGGDTPAGVYSRTEGCDTTAALTVE